MEIAVYASFGVAVLFIIWFARHLLMVDDLQYHQRRNRFVTVAWLLFFPLKMPDDFMLAYLPNISASIASFFIEFPGSWYWNVFYTNLTFTLLSLAVTAVVFVVISQNLYKKE